MAQPHKDEIIRWANSPEGTMVWYKDFGHWIITDNPSWDSGTLYIVDDEWAELRKAQADGKQLQRFSGTWVDEDTLNMGTFEEPKYWRIKPEGVYEWQWIIMNNDSNSYWVTAGYFTSEEEFKKQTNYSNITIVGPNESSKRIRT